MKRQQLYFLIGAALVLAIAGTVFQLVRSAGWKGGASDLEPFAKLPVNSVEKLVITSSKDKVALQKASDIWTVAERSNYPADFSKIRELMTSLWEFKVVRQLDVGPSQFSRLNIVAPGQGDHSGVELNLDDASGKTIKSLIFGKTFGGENSTPDQEEEGPGGSGRFVYDPSEKDKVYLSKENFYTVDASPKNWLDKQFITAEGRDELLIQPVLWRGVDGIKVFLTQINLVLLRRIIDESATPAGPLFFLVWGAVFTAKSLTEDQTLNGLTAGVVQIELDSGMVALPGCHNVEPAELRRTNI